MWNTAEAPAKDAEAWLWQVCRRELELANSVPETATYGGETLLTEAEKNELGW